MIEPRKRRYFLAHAETDEIADLIDATSDQRTVQQQVMLMKSERILQQHKQNLSTHYSAEEISKARLRLAQDLPAIKQLFDDASREQPSMLTDARELIANITNSGANVGAIAALAKLKKADEASFLHSLSVSVLMIAFGRSIKLAEPMVHELAVGGLLHDIGKVAIPASILRKPGKLTESETLEIQKHPVCGFEMLKRFGQASREILEITLFHHERYDGTGYPRRLKGEEIPFTARLAAVCDVYDALTSIRPYKRAFSQAEAMSIMINAKGHFDPELLRAFVQNIIEPQVVI